MHPRPTAPSRDAPLLRLADGTVKQVNPFTGTQVWAVPGRGNRPLEHAAGVVVDVDPDAPEAHCAFCATRRIETTPEKERSVPDGAGGWRTVREVPASELDRTVADARVVGNLFEIISTDYWWRVHGQDISARAREHRRAYLSEEAGRAHVRALLATRLRAAGGDAGAAARTAARLLDDLPHAAHVAVFQNWLRPAGASFDHLHKQVVAIDEPPAQAAYERAALRSDPDLYSRMGVGLAWDEGLVVARNAHAVAVVGVGHRYPSLVVWSTAAACEPWRHDAEQLRGVSDLLHACHAATGPLVPCNEEWHHRQPGGEPAPWRVVLKWRVSTPAGFEGATGVFVTTIDPWALRERVVARMVELRGAGVVAPDVLVGAECGPRPPDLRFREASATD